MFEVAEAYESMMGRWSRQLAPLLVEFVGVPEGEKILDAGCGTDRFQRHWPESHGIEVRRHRSFEGVCRYARNNVTDTRVTFDLGDAQALSYADKSFDRCMALLIVNFTPDAPKAAKEMRRVTKSGGVVAITMWDAAERMNSMLAYGRPRFRLIRQ
jgi:ubiquinone/menaquinone biosynthesis C-methylase UbiE